MRSIRYLAVEDGAPLLAAKRPPFVACGDISPAIGGITLCKGRCGVAFGWRVSQFALPLLEYGVPPYSQDSV